MAMLIMAKTNFLMRICHTGKTTSIYTDTREYVPMLKLVIQASYSLHISIKEDCFAAYNDLNCVFQEYCKPQM